jgi:hypothetical protein
MHPAKAASQLVTGLAATRTKGRESGEETTRWSDAFNRQEYSKNGWDYRPGRAFAHEVQQAYDQRDEWLFKRGKLRAPMPSPLLDYTNKNSCVKEKALGGNRSFHTVPGDVAW